MATKDMERRIVAQLISCLDQLVSDRSPVIVLGATNRPDAIDPGLRRAGRFDREIGMTMPDESARLKILKVLTRNLRLANDVSYDTLARKTPGYVGADITALVNEASVGAVNRIFTALSMPADDEMVLENDLERRIDISRRILGTKTEQKFSPEQLAAFNINMADFEIGLAKVQPSSKREGFITVPSVTWSDVGALQEVRDQLMLSIVHPIRHPELYAKLGMTAPAGILLYGPPGCGKTLVCSRMFYFIDSSPRLLLESQAPVSYPSKDLNY